MWYLKVSFSSPRDQYALFTKHEKFHCQFCQESARSPIIAQLLTNYYKNLRLHLHLFTEPSDKCQKNSVSFILILIILPDIPGSEVRLPARAYHHPISRVRHPASLHVSRRGRGAGPCGQVVQP